MALDRTIDPITWQSGFADVFAWLTSREPRRRPRRSTWRPVRGHRESAHLPIQL